MAVRKWIHIDGNRVGYVTKAEVTPDISTEETPTFDGKVVDSPEGVSWTVSIDKLRYGKTVEDYKLIESLLLSMFTTKKTVTITETTKLADGTEMKVVTKVYNSVITDKKYSVDPEERTVENLEFKGSPCDTWINGEKMQRV